MTRKRPYSKAFTPKDPAKAARYLLDDIPAAFWIRVKAKARRKHQSIRNVILELLTAWLLKP